MVNKAIRFINSELDKVNREEGPFPEATDPVVALDWSSLDLELPVDLDFGGGTPGIPAGSSAGI